MLRATRKLADYKIVKLLLVVIILAFMLTGVSAGFMADFNDNYLVKVGKEKIYPQQIQQKYARLVQSLQDRGWKLTSRCLPQWGLVANRFCK